MRNVVDFPQPEGPTRVRNSPSAISKWDIDDLSYDGLELGAGYAIPVAAGIHITPSVGMDFDGDWERGDATASVSINLSFGSNGIPAS